MSLFVCMASIIWLGPCKQEQRQDPCSRQQQHTKSRRERVACFKILWEWVKANVYQNH